MTSASPKKPPGTNLSTRFLKPETTVAERIDQLTLAHPDEQDLRQNREQQASWLKREMAIHWNVTYRNRSSGSTWTRGYSWPNGNRPRNATR